MLDSSKLDCVSEIACTKEDNRSVDERLDDVLDFIDKYGDVYSYRIMKALEPYNSIDVKTEINRNKSLYSKLAHL